MTIIGFDNFDRVITFNTVIGCTGPNKTNLIKVYGNGKYEVEFYMPTTTTRFKEYTTLTKAVAGAKSGTYSDCTTFRIESVWDTDMVTNEWGATYLPEEIGYDENFDGGARTVISSTEGRSDDAKPKVTLTCLDNGKVKATYESGSNQYASYDYWKKDGFHALKGYEIIDKTNDGCEPEFVAPCGDPNDKGYLKGDCEGCKSGYEDKNDGKGCVEIQSGGGGGPCESGYHIDEDEESETYGECVEDNNTITYVIIGGIALAAIVMFSRVK